MRKRRWLDAATLASLFLFAIVLVMGVRCYVRQESIVYARAAADGDRFWRLSSFGGSLMFSCFWQDANGDRLAPGWQTRSLRVRADSPLIRWSTFGFYQFETTQIGLADGRGRWIWNAGIPYWFLALLTGALPAARLIAAWRARRRAGRPGFEIEPAGARRP